MTSARRYEYLSALGLECWVLRSASPVSAPSRVETPLPVSAPSRLETPSLVGSPPLMAAPSRVENPAPISAAPPASSEARAPVESVTREAGFGWEELRTRVAACVRCSLSATRTQTVFGVGDSHAEWLIVGEAPGADEDARGEPFVGRAGQLLNSMLRAIGLAREQVYIANVLKCRPPGNRDPAPGESAECLPYLHRQIALLRPKIMLAVGRIAAQNLLRTEAPLGGLRLKVHSFGPAAVPLVATYHPAYLLRTPGEKRKVWEDLKFARRVCAGVER